MLNTPMKGLLVVTVLVLLSPLIILLAIVSLVAALGYACYSRLWLLSFCWSRADSIYFICSRRRGWEPFLRNNVVPSLPARVTAVWLEAPQPFANIVRAIRLSGAGHSKPFLVRITRCGIESTPLNADLLTLKHSGRRSTETRTAARKIIDASLSILAPDDYHDDPTVMA